MTGRTGKPEAPSCIPSGSACPGLLVKLYFCLLAAAFLVRLENLILLEFDDMTHAAMGLSILNTGDWFTMHEGVLPTWIKPPLYFWVEALLFKVFGVSEYWARFPSAAAGIMTVALVWGLARRLWGEKTAFFALVALSTSYFFVKYSRRAMLDVPVAFATALGVYALARAELEERGRFYLLYALAAAVGYYLKGVQGLYLFGIAPFYFLLSGQWKKTFSFRFLGSVMLALGLIALWAVPQYLRYGREFFDSQSGLGPLLSMGVASKHSRFYEPFTVLLGVYWPWIPFSLWGIWLAVRELRGPAEARRRSALLLSWFGVILLALSASSAFYLRYLIPLVPPLGAFAALALSRLVPEEGMDRARRVATGVFAALVLFAVCFPVSLDRQGTQYISLYRTINQVTPADARLILYRDKGYRFIHGLVFYARRDLDKHVLTAPALLAEYASGADKKFTIATTPDFKELSASPEMSGVKFEIAASADNWVLFRLAGRGKK
jgi:4-amino-4-deoxy-L-arabinose transferase-like glycosyltransferase